MLCSMGLNNNFAKEVQKMDSKKVKDKLLVRKYVSELGRRLVQEFISVIILRYVRGIIQMSRQ